MGDKLSAEEIDELRRQCRREKEIFGNQSYGAYQCNRLLDALAAAEQRAETLQQMASSFGDDVIEERRLRLAAEEWGRSYFRAFHDAEERAQKAEREVERLNGNHETWQAMTGCHSSVDAPGMLATLRSERYSAGFRAGVEAAATFIETKLDRLMHMHLLPEFMKRSADAIRALTPPAATDVASGKPASKSVASSPAAAPRDACEFCLGAKGGTPGNENIVNGHVICDYCHSLLMPPAGPRPAASRAQPADTSWLASARFLDPRTGEECPTCLECGSICVRDADGSWWRCSNCDAAYKPAAEEPEKP